MWEEYNEKGWMRDRGKGLEEYDTIICKDSEGIYKGRGIVLVRVHVLILIIYNDDFMTWL